MLPPTSPGMVEVGERPRRKSENGTKNETQDWPGG